METACTEPLERQELIQRLIDHGHGPLVDALLLNETTVYTKKGRLNRSAVCRVLSWRPARLDKALTECRVLLAPALGEDCLPSLNG
jgi:hypothetical protein